MKGHRTILIVVLAAVLVFAAARPSPAGILKKLAGGSVIAGAATATDLAMQASALVAFSIAAATANEQCVRAHCAGQLLLFIKAHPLAGPSLVDLYLKKSAEQKPETAGVVAMIDEELRAKMSAAAKAQGHATVKLDPPGDCSKKHHSELNKDISKFCKTQSRTCEPKDSLDDLKYKADMNFLCAAARHNMMQQCYRGGDDTHRDVLKDTLKSLARCESMIQRR